jgi:hypothetical protein
VSELAISLAFFDTAHGLSGTARAGAALLFEGRQVRTLPEPPDLERDGELFTAKLAGHVDLRFEPVSEAARLPGSESWVCEVTGTANGRRIECFGTATVTSEPPEWAQLDSIRAVSAVIDRETAVFLGARRPRNAPGHGDELTRAVLISGGQALDVEDARLSTVYDGEGRQRTAGLELWMPGEDYPRRASGTATAGVSIELGGVRVDAALFEWRIDGRTGPGAYELAVREDDEGAAAA